MVRRFFKPSIVIVILLAWLTGTALADYFIIQNPKTLDQTAHPKIKSSIGKNKSLKKFLALNSKFIEARFPATSEPTSPVQTPEPAEPVLKIPDAPDAHDLRIENKNRPNVFSQYTLLSVAPLFSFSRLDATDNTNGSHATMGSALNLGLEFGWQQFWSELFQTSLNLNAKSETFTATSSLPINNSTQVYGGIDLEAKTGRETSLQGLVHLGVEQAPFIRGASVGVNTIDAIAIPDVGVGISLPIYNSQIFSFKFEPTVDYLAPATTAFYNVQSGYTVMGKFTLEQKSQDSWDHKRLSANLFFSYGNQNTTLTNQTVQELGASLNFSFDFFQNSARRQRREDEE